MAELNADLRRVEETARPKAALIREPVEEFDRRLREADDAEKARALLSRVVAEYDAVRDWYGALKRWEAGPVELQLARRDRHEASKRFTAAMLLSTSSLRRITPTARCLSSRA